MRTLRFQCASAEEMLEHHTIIAGYGLPGRAVGDLLHRQHRSICVIEMNPRTAERMNHHGANIITGDVCDPDVLRQAGIEHAELLIIAIPEEKAALRATKVARGLSSTVRIVTRCHYVSTGIEARAAGADSVIVAEQVVAEEMVKLMERDAQHRPVALGGSKRGSPDLA